MKFIRLAAVITAAAGVAGTVSFTVSPAARATSYLPCAGSALAVTHSYVDAGMGHRWMYLLFRNQTSTTCTINGFPSAVALNSARAALAPATDLGTPHTVVLTPGRYAAAGLQWSAFNSSATGPCLHWSTYLDVKPAHTNHTVRFVQSVSTCQLQVQPTQPSASVDLTYYAYAQRWWIRGASASDATRGSYWYHAEANLKLYGSLYAYQVSELGQLIAMPDTGLTNAQRQKVIALTKSLNSFFGTPGLYF